jgi:hypothetical protein
MRRWRRFTLADMRRIARERDGKCLSKTYKAIYSPLLWSCNKSHPNWWATAASIVKGSWCQPCVRERVAAAQRNSISEYQKIANQRGGRLLSIEYKNNIQKLSWECGLGISRTSCKTRRLVSNMLDRYWRKNLPSIFRVPL